MRYAQIVDDRVYGIFNYETLPIFDDSIVMIDITDNPSVEIGMLYLNGIFSLKTVSLEEEKGKLIERINTKAGAVISLFQNKYRVSDELKTLEKLSQERKDFNRHKDDYYLLATEAEKKEHLKLLYPVIYGYMIAKNRTVEEQVAKIMEKEKLASIVSAKVEVFISQINAVETIEGLHAIDDVFVVIEQMETVAEFMTAMMSI